MGAILMVSVIVSAILASMGVGMLAIMGFVNLISRNIPK
jgi:predicted membrane-bound spermidine synthase